MDKRFVVSAFLVLVLGTFSFIVLPSDHIANYEILISSQYNWINQNISDINVRFSNRKDIELKGMELYIRK